ncbi:acyl-CoA dehydrogenase family protein [Pseudonocardia sp. WMMC193]|uniref:acyl-CoA dehydrogenase family protein n=1 Tax=Pseudonocardia sp. WMMC193 TaxID=2911965 RepID=UPI0035ABC769
MTVTPQGSISGDPLGSVRLCDVALDPADVSAPLPPTAADEVRDVGAAPAAVELVGLADELLAHTVAHVGTRVQFGRPTGSLQAVAHHVADMGAELECARLLVAAAPAELDTRPAPRRTAAAKARASRAGHGDQQARPPAARRHRLRHRAGPRPVLAPRDRRRARGRHRLPTPDRPRPPLHRRPAVHTGARRPGHHRRLPPRRHCPARRRIEEPMSHDRPPTTGAA